MRELSEQEVEQVSGGIWPVVVAVVTTAAPRVAAAAPRVGAAASQVLSWTGAKFDRAMKSILGML